MRMLSPVLMPGPTWSTPFGPAELEGRLEHGRKRRHHRGDDRTLEILLALAVQVEDVVEEHRVFHLGFVRLGEDMADEEAVFRLVSADGDVGVAHVDGKDHMSASSRR